MANNNSNKDPITVVEYLNEKNNELEYIIPSSAKSHPKHTAIYVTALVGAFIVCYGISGVVHTNNIDKYTETGEGLVTDIDDLGIENAYEQYQAHSLGNDVSTAKNGGYTLNVNSYTVIPSDDGNSLTVQNDSTSFELAGPVSGLNLIDNNLWYVDFTGALHKCDTTSGQQNEIVYTGGPISEPIITSDYLFYITKDGTDRLVRRPVDGGDPLVLVSDPVKDYVIMGNAAIYLTSDKVLNKLSLVTSDSPAKTGSKIADNIDDFQYNGDLIALNKSSLISFEANGSDYKELVADKDVNRILGASYQHIYYSADDKVYDLNTDTMETTELADADGVIYAVDSIDGRTFITRKVHEGDSYVYSNAYLN